MKKSILSLIVLSILQLFYTAENWAQNTQALLTSALYDAAIWDVNHAAAVGANSLLTTQNQGDSWSRLPINRPNYRGAISQVTIANSQVGIAIGNDGTILRTIDRGVSWTQIPSGTGNEDFYKVQFIDGVGYIVGRYRFDNTGFYTPVLYKSLDLGASWEEVPSNIINFASSNPSFRMYFVSSSVGYLQVGGDKYMTIDGGITWEEDVVTPASLDLRSMQFIDENTGYAYANTTGDYLVHESLDGGSIWSPLSFTQFSEVFEIVGDKIYYGGGVGGGGGVTKADLNGSNQQLVPIPQQGTITDIEFFNANLGYVIGRTPNSLSTLGRFIFKTTDGGTSWIAIDDTSHLEQPANRMTYLNKVAPNTYVRSDLNAVAGNTDFHIIHSYDNGASWQVTRTYDVGGEINYADGNFICHVRYFDPFNSGNGVIVSESNDGGQTFNDGPVITEFPAFFFNFWEQVSEDDIFVSLGSDIYYSNDQGLNWGTRSPPNGITSFRTQFLSATSGYLYGENTSTEVPEIFQTTDGGQSWTLLFDIPTHFYNWSNDAFDFSDPDRLIVIPQFPTGSAFLYDLNNSNVSIVTAPEYVNQVKSVNSSSFAAMTNQNGTYYTNDNGTNYTQLIVDIGGSGTTTTVPPFFVEPDESMTFYDYRYVNRVKVETPLTPDFLIGPEVADLGTTTHYFLPQDPFANTEWELISGGNLILDPNLEEFRASVEWTAPGTHTLRARRTSDFGNSAYVSIQVFVNNIVDTTPPTVITQDISVNLDQNGSVTIEATDIDNGSFDDFTPMNLLEFELDIYSFFCSNIGENVVTLTVTDLSGNSASATAIVTVVDELAPEVITQNITVDLMGNPSVSISPEDVNNGSSDNCSIDTLELDITSFNAPGIYTVQLTAIDSSNNEGVASAEVTVIDTVLGISIMDKMHLRFIPNPVDTKITVLSSEPYLGIGVIDVTGRQVLVYDYNNEYDLTSLDTGFYLLVFQLENGDTMVKKLIKK
jgi:photosystem II stability/assembly factor-like uncharacterized protein